MLIYSATAVHLDHGEPRPVKCEQCQTIYQRTHDDSIGSRCRTCGYGNWHPDQRWEYKDDDLYHYTTNRNGAKIYDCPDDAQNGLQ